MVVMEMTHGLQVLPANWLRSLTLPATTLSSSPLFGYIVFITLDSPNTLLLDQIHLSILEYSVVDYSS
jgi:hypothetical protein